MPFRPNFRPQTPYRNYHNYSRRYYIYDTIMIIAYYYTSMS